MIEWLGREKIKEQIENSQRALYIIIEEAGKEGAVIREILEELAEGSVGAGDDWYSIPDWKHFPDRVALSEPQGGKWYQYVHALPKEVVDRYWQEKEKGEKEEKIVEELAAEILEELGRLWPEYVEYHAGLIENILQCVETPEYMETKEWLPRKLWKGGERPVVCAEGVSRGMMAGYEERHEAGEWNPGLLQRAAEGYLLIEAAELLGSSGWPVLRDALLRDKIQYPCSAPLKATVVLYGSGNLYRLFQEWDPAFEILFKQTIFMPADVENTEEGKGKWKEAIGRRVQFPISVEAEEWLLKQLWRKGEYGRIPCCVEKADLWLRAAEKICWEEDLEKITVEIMGRVFEGTRENSRQNARRYWEREKEAWLQIDLEGKTAGRINGLAVVDTGGMAIGEPLMITAAYKPLIRVENAEEKYGLSGCIFSKSWEILKGYLGLLKGKKGEITVNFEKNYGSIEGDSALLAQAYCILSLLSGCPMFQNIAVTGTIDSRGRVLRVGGIHEKIEGFYDFCCWRKKRGGVILPLGNMEELSLAEDVSAAIGRKEFFLYPIACLEEGIPLLMGSSARCVLRKAIRRMK